jgi:hypothetical protein
MKLAKPNIKLLVKRVGAEGARWAHNPKVGGSKPSPAKIIKILHKYKYKYKNQFVFIQQFFSAS